MEKHAPFRYKFHDAAVEAGLSVSFLRKHHAKFGHCCVNAIHNATGTSWLTLLYTFMLTEPTSPRDGVTDYTYGKYLKKHGWEIVFPESKIKIKDLPRRGTFIVATPKHLNCVKNGTLIDTRDRRSHSVHSYWRKKK